MSGVCGELLGKHQDPTVKQTWYQVGPFEEKRSTTVQQLGYALNSAKIMLVQYEKVFKNIGNFCFLPIPILKIWKVFFRSSLNSHVHYVHFG